MRNLKKILALVLALVMSLSLMATAGAASFPDVADDNPYETAIDVLTQLGVITGFTDGSFQPNGTLTRAQAAALFYRIATGDVKNEYVQNYTYMASNKFNDLAGAEWARGYINYCQNAGIVIGTSATTFSPSSPVTGYQLMIMMLRTLGYDKYNEFRGAGWELKSASKCESLGILKNILNTGDFGAPATRAMTAEIIFRGMLQKTVKSNSVANTGYNEDATTLGYQELGLEEIEGVVVGNEFADLNSDWVLPEGKTELQVEGEDAPRTLSYTTKITDIGESRLVYTQNTSKVLKIADTGVNVTKEYGEGVDISTPYKFSTVSGLTETKDTEYYTNFEPTGYYTSDWRIEYEIILGNRTAANMESLKKSNGGTYTGPNAAGEYTYTKRIPAGQPITETDYSFMQTIFFYSNGKENTVDKNTASPYAYDGKVFVATQTNTDISDELSFRQFNEKYINPIVSDKNWNNSGNGIWVKFIDNDGDGNAEYAFYTWYSLTEAVSSYTNKAGDVVMQYAWGDTRNSATDGRAQIFDDNDHEDGYTVRYMEDDEAVTRDVAVGDIVLAAKIDNQFLVSEAESVTTKVKSYNYKDDEITTVDGTVYGQSKIGNDTTMQELIASMAPDTNYEMFLDKFGFVRAYRLPNGVQYALVTEIYYKNNAQGNLIQNWPMTVDLTIPDEDGKPVTKEYNLTNTDTELKALVPWTQIFNKAQTGNYNNWLQPAIAHLGVNWLNMTTQRATPKLNPDPATGAAATLTYWDDSMQRISDITSFNGSTEFDYGKQTYVGCAANNVGNLIPVDRTTSFTNVAVVTIDGDNATIHGAADVRLANKNGAAAGDHTANNYAVDYIQLSTGYVAAGSVAFDVDPSANTGYTPVSYNTRVNADKDTEIYVISDNEVRYYKGYSNMPALTADTVTGIHAAYAVARNTNTGTSSNNYWIANVLVFEIDEWKTNLSKNSVALTYWTASQQLKDTTVTIDTLNSKTTPAKVQLVPNNMAWGTVNNWWSEWGWNANTGFGWHVTDDTNRGYGFYQLYNETAPVDGVMTAATMKKITEKYYNSNIYSGIVTREVDLATSGYIPVNMTGARYDVNDVGPAGELKTEAYIKISSENVYSITGDFKNNNDTNNNWTYVEADNLWYNNTVYSQVKANDRLIWVGGGAQNKTVNSANFLVDLGSNTFAGTSGENGLLDNTELWEKTPVWLDSLWDAIQKDRNKPVDHSNQWKVTIEHVEDGTGDKVADDTTVWVDKGSDWSIAAKDLAISGYTIKGNLSAKNTATNAPVPMLLGGGVQLGNYGILASQLLQNTTVTVTYEAVGYSLKVAGAADQTSTAVVTYVDTNNETQTTNKITLNSANAMAQTTVSKLNREFTIVVTVPAGVRISVDKTKVDSDSWSVSGVSGTVTIKGKVTGNAVVTITESKRALVVEEELANGATTLGNVSVNLNENGASTLAFNTRKDVAVGDDYVITFTAAPNTDYEYSTDDGKTFAPVPADGITGKIADVWTTTVIIKATGFDQDKINAEIAKTVTFTPLTDAVAVPHTPGLGYHESYVVMGINVAPNGDKTTITVDEERFIRAMGTPDSTGDEQLAINTMINNPGKTVVAAGVSLKLPATANAVEYTWTDTLGNSGRLSKTTAAADGVSDVNSTCVNLWAVIADLKDGAITEQSVGDGGTNLIVAPQGFSMRQSYTKTYTIQFYNGNTPVGGPITRTIEMVIN